MALADKLDTLAGFFAIDERPTGSKDPFALRRAALGVIRLILENRLRLPLGDALTTLSTATATRCRSRGRRPHAMRCSPSSPTVSRCICATRVCVTIWSAPSSRRVTKTTWCACWRESDALERFLARKTAANLLTAYRRAANILRIEEKKDGRNFTTGQRQTPNLFVEEQERELHHCESAMPMQLRGGCSGAIHFEDVMTTMATLRAPVDAFFDHVTVNCENDPARRRNRLLMLSQIRATLDLVADFSKIEG